MLKALNTPKLGDSLLKADGTPWMADLAHRAPKINWDDLTQTAALPLGSWLKIDPWDDKVHMLNAKRYAPMNARDKMPLEVTPIFYKLQRYEEAQLNAPAAPATNTDAAPAADPQPSAPQLAYRGTQRKAHHRPHHLAPQAPVLAATSTASGQQPTTAHLIHSNTSHGLPCCRRNSCSSSGTGHLSTKLRSASMSEI